MNFNKQHFMAGIVTAIFVALLANLDAAAQDSVIAVTNNMVQLARAAAKAGELAFRLTTPDELKALLGAPAKEHTESEDGKSFLAVEYPEVRALFGQFGENVPTTLFGLTVQDQPVDIGRGGTLCARRLDDLPKLGTFWGVIGVSLVKLDLTGQMPLLERLPFDNRTGWPAKEKLPKGFDPAKLLDEGKNPGLGIHALHKQGLDGRGVHIAIIDQPLLRGHVEYKDRIVEYTEIEVEGFSPQMHGSPVTSIAVGVHCGTAPAASVHYYAVPTWKWWNEHCKPYAATLDRILERNRSLPAADQIRVVSLSLGAMSQWSDHQLWAEAVQRAQEQGVLVVTCDPAYYRLVTLKRKLGTDIESPTNYVNQFGFSLGPALGVPAGNRVTAGHTGPTDYVFWREGGMSWTVPYLAGLAAAAFQVDPGLKPQEIPGLWTRTAARTSAGLVVNPPAFIEAVRTAKAARRSDA